MSIAMFPRLYFKGEMSWDPSLSNNFDDIHDPINGSITLPPNTTLADVRSRLAVSQGRSWNHYGTHSARFEDVRVTGWSRDAGALAGADPVIGMRLGLEARLVDNNPLMDHGTQLFFDKLVIGDPETGFEAKRDKRLFARFLNFSRNRTFTRTSGRPGSGPASAADATWEVCFPRDNLTPAANLQSPALRTLFALLDDAAIAGICVRFRVYRTLYYQNGIKNSLPQQPRSRPELEALYAAGANFSNPAYSVVCGAIMPWRTGEPVGHPAGRILLPQVNTGVVFAEVESGGQRFTLDFGSAIPEEDETLVKGSYGDLDVVATVGSTEHLLGRLTPTDYDRAAYEAKGGLIDLDLSAATGAARTALDNGLLSVRSFSGELFRESAHLVVVEDRDTYLDQGERADIALRVLKRGRPAPQGTVVHVAKYGMDLRYVDEPVASLLVDATGVATLRLAADAPGFVSYVFVAAESGAPTPNFEVELNAATDFHANLRVLPFDDQLEGNTADSQLTWEWIYEHILAFWDTQNPVMARRQNPAINKSLNSRSVVENMTNAIRTVCGRDAVETLRYMPPARDLSAGKRRLLLRWCDLVDNGTAPEASAQPLHVRFRSSDPRTL